MRRLWLIAALIALGGCATVYEDRYGYYPESGYGGDYYYDPEPAAHMSVGLGYGYSAYDSVFWGIQHSYLDPFWYPGFHYGVTYFPSYYGWSSWYAGDYWRWRNFHPYSPYYGSYWDHYYDWNWRHRYRHGGFRDGDGDSHRYGSARNAAERMARSSRTDGRGDLSRRRAWTDGGVAAPRAAYYGRGVDGSRGMATRSARGWDSEGLRSRSYAPAARRPVSPSIGSRGGESVMRDRTGRGVGNGRFDTQGRQAGGFVPADSQPSFRRGGYPSVGDSRTDAGAPNVRATPQFEQRSRAPAPREFRQSAPSRTFEQRPSMRGHDNLPSMRSSGGNGRSSTIRGSSRGRSER